MSYWKPLIHNGQTIDLSHLEPFDFPLLPKGSQETVKIRVSFNNHCFSEEFNRAKHGSPLPKTHVPAHEQRGFDQLRYDLSKLLPDLVRQFAGSRIAQTRTGPLVKVTLADGKTYGIFFVLKKLEPAICELFIMSAYPLERGQQVAATGGMKFEVAVALVLQGKRPKFPPGRF